MSKRCANPRAQGIVSAAGLLYPRAREVAERAIDARLPASQRAIEAAGPRARSELTWRLPDPRSQAGIESFLGESRVAMLVGEDALDGDRLPLASPRLGQPIKAGIRIDGHKHAGVAASEVGAA
jgi:hypothetical protein